LRTDDELRRTYDLIASDFAAQNAVMPANLMVLADRLRRHVGSHGLILDIGCGHGRDTAWLERFDGRVIGLDLSFQMLKRAQQITRGRLAEMNMKKLGIRDSCADGIWCNAALLHLPKVQAPLALAEFRRILHSGGMLIVTVQQGIYEGVRYGKNNAWTRHFSEYQPDEIRALLAANHFSVSDQLTNPGGGSGTWLQTVALGQ
jgi:ubiquinone/menaquinone biosynthesis C-methylase UbiE